MVELTSIVFNVITYLIVALEVVYVLFAFLLMRQVSIMNKAFTSPIGALYTLLSYAHFFAALGLVILSVIFVI